MKFTKVAILVIFLASFFQVHEARFRRFKVVSSQANANANAFSTGVQLNPSDSTRYSSGSFGINAGDKTSNNGFSSGPFGTITGDISSLNFTPDASTLIPGKINPNIISGSVRKIDQINVPKVMPTGGMDYKTIVPKVTLTDMLDPALRYVNNPNVDNEGKPWIEEGIIGYSECSLQGSTKVWKNNAPDWYRFSVLEGKVKQIGEIGPSVPVKSFRVPKGYKLEYKGMFLRNKYEHPLTPQQKDLIADIPDLSFAKHVVSYNDERCAINMDFWYMNLQVTATEYAQIAGKIPKLLQLCMENQQLYIEQSQIQSKIDKFDQQKIIDEKAYNEQSNFLLGLNTSLQNNKSKMSSYKSELVTVRRYLFNEITEDYWTEEVKTYREKMKVNEEKLKINEQKISHIYFSVKQLEKEIHSLRETSSHLLIQAESARKEIKAVEIKSSETIIEIETTEKTLINKSDEVSKYVEANSQLEMKIASYKEEILKYQRFIAEAEASIRTNNMSAEKGRKQLEEFNEKKTKITIRKTDISKQYSEYKEKISKFEYKINSTRKEIEEKSKLWVDQKAEIAKIEIENGTFTSENNQWSSFIKARSHEHYKKREITVTQEITKIEKTVQSEESSYSAKNVALMSLKNKLDKYNNLSNSLSSDRTSFNEHRTKIATKKSEITSMYREITSIFDQQTGYLNNLINLSSEATTFESWVIKAKENIKKYLNSLPANTNPINDMVRRRRRKLRRMRRYI